MAKKKLAKVVDTPRGPANAIVPLQTQAYSIRVNYEQSQGIIRGNGSDWMGPLNPMAPVAPPEVAGRRFDYVVGANLQSQPRGFEIVGFPTMRALADSFDILRLVIETRKDQLSRLKWNFSVGAKDAKGKPKTPKNGQQAKIDELTAFWRRPDGRNKWRPWIRSVLEDKFVIDAVSLYCQRNRGGKLAALKQIDGATVKVILDDWGRTPEPWSEGGKIIVPPAYKQVLKGLPAVNYAERDLVYRPYNRRVHKAYGYSEVEQIVITVNIALRRQMFQLAYYTEGNVPEALIGTPDNWTPDQVMAFQINFDQMLQGNLAARRRIKFVPSGVGKNYVPTKEPDLVNPMDEWLARVVCFAFSVSPQQFVKMMNRATAQTSDDTSKEEGSEPLKEYIADMVNDVSETEFGVENGEIVFGFEEETEVDQEKQQKIVTGYTDAGLKTINEGREMLGDEPFDDPAADVPMLKTATGYVPIGANTLEGKQAMIDAGLAPDPVAMAEAAAAGAGSGGDGSPPGAKKPPFGGKGPAKPNGATGGDPTKKAHVAHAILTAGFAKASRATRRARRLAPVPFDRPATRRAERSIARALRVAFKTAASATADLLRDPELTKAELPPGWQVFGQLSIAARSNGSASATLSNGGKIEAKALGGELRDQSGDGYHGRVTWRYIEPDGTSRRITKDAAVELIAEHDGALTKASVKELAGTIAEKADLDAIVAVIPDIADKLASVASDSVGKLLAQLGVDDRSELVNQVNEVAVEEARDHAAELVGMRFDKDGDLVEAKRAEYRIDETTRDDIRDIVTSGLEDNLGVDAIADAIEESTAFSHERADLIARTEVSRANSDAALASFKGAREAGVETKKEWQTTDEACPICQDNEDEGAIDLDDEFSSGDDAPPAHPNCRCVLVPIVQDDEE